jgi:hypothetical protein
VTGEAERVVELTARCEDVENRALELFDAFAELAVRAHASGPLLREVGRKANGSLEWVASIRERRLGELRARLNPEPVAPEVVPPVSEAVLRGDLGLTVPVGVRWHDPQVQASENVLRLEDEEGDQVSRLPDGRWWWSLINGQRLQLVDEAEQAVEWEGLHLRTRWKSVLRSTMAEPETDRENPIKFER